MRRQARWISGSRAALLAGLALAGIGRPAAAQFFGGLGNAGANSSGTASMMAANPYANPMLNPYLNPYASLYGPATQQNAAQNAALYFLAAQASSGGIGSGQMSGTRARPGAQTPVPVSRTRRDSDIPGAGAARYFNRSVKPGVAKTGSVPSNRYNRYGNYYSANGH